MNIKRININPKNVSFQGHKKTLDKRALWELSLEEFNKRYDDLLRVVLKTTTDEDEKFNLGKYFETMEEL